MRNSFLVLSIFSDIEAKEPVCICIVKVCQTFMAISKHQVTNLFLNVEYWRQIHLAKSFTADFRRTEIWQGIRLAAPAERSNLCHVWGYVKFFVGRSSLWLIDAIIGWIVESRDGDTAQEHAQLAGVHWGWTDREDSVATVVSRWDACRCVVSWCAISDCH